MKITDQKRNITNGIIVLVLLVAVDPLMAQTCNSAIIPSAPDSRYQDNGDGTVSDLKTGLMWQQCSAGQSGNGCATGSLLSYSWDHALQYPQTLNSSGGFAGYTDWYLPNLNELESLVEEACYTAINLNLFPNTSNDLYWSASPNANYTEKAWYVHFGNGRDGNQGSRHGSRDDSNHVRLVRIGQ